MKKLPLLNSSEYKTFRLIEKAVRYTPYEVKCKVRMQAVLKEEQGDFLNSKLQQTLRQSEFDFVVYNDERGTEPLFAIEFDGPQHQFDPEQIQRDIRKNYLCHLAQLPLIRITDTEIEDLDKFTIIEFIIRRYNDWHKSRYEIQKEIIQYMDSLSEEQERDLFKDFVVDCSIDPKFRFNLRYPFPRTIDVVKRLLFQHKVITELAQPFLRKLTKHENYYFFADIFAYHNNVQFVGYDLVTRSDYVISQSNEPFFGIKTISSENDRQNSIILKRGAVNFRIRCTLPIVYDYDPSEAPIDYILRTGKYPVSLQELPGTNAFDIANNVSEYLCLREIEKWAKKTGK